MLLAAACFSPRYDAPLCAEDGSCPDGLRCGNDGVCGDVTGIDAAAIDSSDDAVPSIDADGDARPDACVPGPELCNGADDDCDAVTDEGIDVGGPCDGADGDACSEGTIECDLGTGGIRCSDTTGTQLEQCNGTDDDCDAAIDEGFDLTSDELNCGMCGRLCSNGFGTNTCANSTCAPTCSAGANDCDSNPVTGCELRNTNPACGSAAPLESGSVVGDVGAPTLTANGYAEAAYTVRVVESASGVVPLRAQVTLTSPPGTNFDLDVACIACGGVTLSSSNATSTDVVEVRRDDRAGVSDAFDMIVTVRWTSSVACGNWTLTVTGNAGTIAAQTCPP